MSTNKVEAALKAAYKAASPEWPTDYPAKSFNPPKDDKWARVRNFPADNSVATLGDDGEDNYAGFFQIDLFQPQDGGTKTLNDKADEYRRYFSAGRRFTYQGQEVVIRRAVPSGIGSAEGFADDVITITVYWYSRFQRTN